MVFLLNKPHNIIFIPHIPRLHIKPGREAIPTWTTINDSDEENEGDGRAQGGPQRERGYKKLVRQDKSNRLKALADRIRHCNARHSRTTVTCSLRMIVVGLTGGIATGKSTVSELLKAKHVPIIDADVLARQVVQPGTSALANIVAHFGPAVLLPDGSLDRKRLGSIIFNDEAKRRKLNSIVHPAVRRAMFWGVLTHWFRGSKCCVMDVPLLIEGGVWKWVGKVVVVYCSAEIQHQRLMNRDNSSREDASSRLRSQLPITEKVEYADQVLENSGSLQDLEVQVDAFVQRLERDSGWTWRVSWLCPPFGLLSAIWVLAWRAVRRYRLSVRRRSVVDS